MSPFQPWELLTIQVAARKVAGMHEEVKLNHLLATARVSPAVLVHYLAEKASENSFSACQRNSIAT